MTFVAPAVFDVARIRADFPILGRTVRGKPLVYLDNAATTQKPQPVLDAIAHYYTGLNANVHRGVHELSERATEAYEAARSRVRTFFNAADTHEIVFTRNATEGINLVAHSFARPRLQAGDEVLITAFEHHSNIVPWQLACEATGSIFWTSAQVLGAFHQLWKMTWQGELAAVHWPTKPCAGMFPPCPLTSRKRRNPWDLSELRRSASTAR